MTKIITTLLTSLLIIGSQLSAQEVLKLETFDDIEISGGHEVEIIRSKNRELSIEMKKGDRSDVEIVVKSGKLKIRTSSFLKNSRVKAKIKIMTPSWTDIKASAGSSVFSLENWSGDELNLDASSGADLKVVVNAAIVTAQVSSGATLKVKGTTGGAKLKASSGADLNAIELKSALADADCSSGGSIKIWVNEELRAKVSSGGSVGYRGNAQKVNVKKSSGGSVDRL